MLLGAAGGVLVAGTVIYSITRNEHKKATEDANTEPTAQPEVQTAATEQHVVESPSELVKKPGHGSSSTTATAVSRNALEQQAIDELNSFGSWLSANSAKGFVGELGWPAGNDAGSWNSVADHWYQAAQNYDIWTTAWAAGSWWGSYKLTIYAHGSGPRSLDTAHPQASILEKFFKSSNKLHGVNVAGMEFGNSVTNTNPGTPGRDYFYEPRDSFAYLAARGVKIVRLPFRWERIQPSLNGALKDSEITEIRRILDSASAYGIRVVLDLHNYGEYKTAGGVLKLGAGITHESLVDVWVKLSQAFKGHPGLLAYGIMNEPHDLPTGGYPSAAKNWEAASQKVVSALRAAGDGTLVMVAGYDWSSLARWSKNHPSAWISDSSNSVRYEAHHYWDRYSEGFYDYSFAQELAM